MGRLQTARKARPDTETLRWVAVGIGYLAIGHRPSRISPLCCFR